MNRLTTSALALLGLAALLTGCDATAINSQPPAPPAPPAPILGTGTPADPLQLPYANTAPKMDADAADWSTISFLPAPFMKKTASSVKMSWTESGLYILAVIKDATPQPELNNPWEGDCLELFIEKDAAGAIESSDNTVQFCISPTPDRGEGKCSLSVAQGEQSAAGKIASAWKKTPTGYNLEMLIPAATLNPAKLAAGTKLNLNFAIDDAGKPTEQFYCDKNADEGYKTPKSWATIILKK